MTTLDSVNGTVCNATQYFQSLQSRDSDGPLTTNLTRGDTIGLVLAAQASSLSCICVIIIFIWIGWNVHWYKKTFPNGNWKLFQRPADIYMFSLFLFDLIQAIGGILNIKWVHSGIVTTGPYCTAQGLVEQIGDLGVALITFLLAVHTFVAIVWQVGLEARGVALGLVSLACIFITLWVVIGPLTNIDKNYETPTPYWCWINPRFIGDRLGGEYGFWSADEEHRFHWSDPDQRVEYAQTRATQRMLLYPLAYSLVVLPITIARYLQFHHYRDRVSSAGTFFANSTFYLSGAINVLLLIIRPELLLFPRPKQLDREEIQLTLAPQGYDPAHISDTANFQHSPERTSAALGDGSRVSTRLSQVNSTRRISDDI